MEDCLDGRLTCRGRSTGASIADVSMTGQPRSLSITAIIPTHNRPERVRAAVQSVQNQTQTVDEILVVDDARNAETARTVNLISLADPRVRLVRNDRPGAAASRNCGLREASGRFCAFLDDDDAWLPGCVQTLVEAILLDSSCAAYGSMLVIGGSNATVRCPVVPRTLGHLLERNPGFGGVNGLFSTEILRSVGGFDEQLASFEDKELAMRLLGMDLPVTCRRDLVALVSDHGQKRVSNSNDHSDAMAFLARRYNSQFGYVERRFVALRIRLMRSMDADHEPRISLRFTRGVIRLRSAYLHVLYRHLSHRSAYQTMGRASRVRT